MNDTSLWLLGSEGRNIPYRPQLAAVTGSVISAILLQQMVYWWKTVGKKGFYKFNTPCSHPMYRVGDSWLEELQIGESRFRSALKKIATKVLTKEKVKEMLSDPNTVAVNQSVIYFTDKSNRNWFYLNPSAMDATVEKAYHIDEELQKRIRDSKKDLYEDPLDEIGGYESTLPTAKIAVLLKNIDYTQERISGEIKIPEKKDVKNQNQSKSISLFKYANKMPTTFTLNPDILSSACAEGYELQDVRDEVGRYIDFYTKGKGASKTHYDWNRNFLSGWLTNNYRWGYIKRNGQFYKLDANEERSATLRRQANTDLFAHITD